MGRAPRPLGPRGCASPHTWPPGPCAAPSPHCRARVPFPCGRGRAEERGRQWGARPLGLWDAPPPPPPPPPGLCACRRGPRESGQVSGGRRLRRARGGPGVGRERGRGGRSSPRRLKATGSSRGSWNILMLVIFTDLQQLCGLRYTWTQARAC
ncbi:bcl-2-binding component 3, isoforms 3/4-like isoform X3 [Canis lupus dingo]|uniref:bcl-2-binding component 3, isoforms 3/4-like isoform X3 n=1 Tax=Canis lupus dingo TaxID=286419 RepID=UPI0020C292E2|nr:bcl-2-binding component 3, isoforms 3/4-like isoform X3 [Canis lupus dingo]